MVLAAGTGRTGQDSIADVACHIGDGEAGYVHVAMGSVQGNYV